jgi:LuxR family maltose regulon positive regulatory protein
LGHTDLLTQWIEERGISTKDKLSCRVEPEHIVLARFLISQDRPEEADRFLKRLIKNAKADHRVISVLMLRLVRVKALYAQAKIGETVQELKKALALGEKAEFIHVFTMEGKMIARLIARVLEEHKRTKVDQDTAYSTEYIKKILAAFEEDKSQQKMVGIDESLSEREIEVLKLIATGLTNQEIADRLFISLNTVRTHTKNINSKLNVHSRTQAIARAKKLGLI